MYEMWPHSARQVYVACAMDPLKAPKLLLCAYSVAPEYILTSLSFSKTVLLPLGRA